MIFVLAVIVIVISVTYIAQNGGEISGTNVICPKWRSTIHIPGDGIYTCNICNNDFAYGQHNSYGVGCPSCGKGIFVPGAGAHTCPKCNNDFFYREHTGDIIKCPKCFKNVFIQGEGTHTCTKCYNTFTYGEQKSNTIHTEPIHNINYSKYYDVLGCSYNATEDEVNQKYKEMAMKFHPNKIISKDLPEELIQFSTNKFIEIQEAYEKIKSNKIKVDIPQVSGEEIKYFTDWKFIKDGVKVPHAIVKYFRGQHNIDKQGNFYNKDFYFYVNAHNVLFMLTVSFVNKAAFWSLRNQELEWYTLSPDKTMTIISTLEGDMRETIQLSASAYDVMLENYPAKDAAYIKQQKIV